MHGRVVSTVWLTPALVRVVLGGGDLERLEMPEATDAYVNVAIPPHGAPYDAVFSPAAVKDEHAQEHWPARRRYSVRRWDEDTHELTLDVVVHGSEGVGGPWAAGVAPGDVLVLEGPGGGYRPDATADWHLLVGDESALPAIAASLEVVPAGVPAVVRLVCDGPEHEIALDSPGELDLVWLHRGGNPDAAPGDPDLLVAAVGALQFPPGRVHAFVHGEADEIRAIRRHLLLERGLSRQSMSCSPYWRRSMTDESWRQVKRRFVAAMEADVEVA